MRASAYSVLVLEKSDLLLSGVIFLEILIEPAFTAFYRASVRD